MFALDQGCFDQVLWLPDCGISCAICSARLSKPFYLQEEEVLEWNKSISYNRASVDSLVRYVSANVYDVTAVEGERRLCEASVCWKD